MTSARASLASIALVALFATVAGCATVVAGGPDQVPINTNPQGAYVYVNGQVVGQTPTVVTLDRHLPAQIQIFLPGFQPIVIVRDKTLNLWTLGNLLIGVFPVIVDLITGDFQAYDGTPISLGLSPAQGGAPVPPVPVPVEATESVTPPAPPPPPPARQ